MVTEHVLACHLKIVLNSIVLHSTSEREFKYDTYSYAGSENDGVQN